MHSRSARLGLGRRPIDLVGEDDLAHDRARPELELARLLVEDRQARDVRGQQVRRELDPPERAAEAAGDGLREHRLAGPGHVLDEQVPTTEERHEGEADFVMLADDDALDVGQDAVTGFLDLGHRPLSLAPSTDRAGRTQGRFELGMRHTGLVCRRRIVRRCHSGGSQPCRRPCGPGVTGLNVGAGSAPRPTASSRN